MEKKSYSWTDDGDAESVDEIEELPIKGEDRRVDRRLIGNCAIVTLTLLRNF